MKHKVLFATVRSSTQVCNDGVGEYDVWDIECRFQNGEKYAAIQVCVEQEDLAHAIADWLSNGYD